MQNESLLNLVDINVDQNMVDSLLDTSSDNIQEPQEESLLSSDSLSFVELNNDIMSEHEIYLRKKFFSDPKNQAKILLDNYIKSQTILVNHKQRRKVYSEFLRNAKKGKYKGMFSEYINGISKDESQKKFSNLNG